MKILKASSLLILFATLFFSCQKEYSLEHVVTAAGTWEFKDSTKLFAGNIDTAYIDATGATRIMTLQGKSSDGAQTFLLHLYATDSFTVGNYKASLSQTDFAYYTQAKTFYTADQSTFPLGEFTVVITAIGNNSVTGTFSGASEDSTGALKPLTLGKFSSRINLSGNGTGGGGSGSASGVLGVSAGSCTPYTPSGIYTQGITLTSSNTVGVTVTVTTPGSYVISTNTVNGVSFSSSGTFTTVGTYNVILTGSGTPVSSGPQNFAVTFGASTCNFSITFLPGTAPVGDYFPTTVNSFWDYGLQGGQTSDSFRIKVAPGTFSANSNTYSVFQQDNIPASGSPDSLFYRKNSGNYYEYFNAEDFYGLDAGTANPKYIEYLFLNESANVTDTWQSTSVTGKTTINNIPNTSVTIYIKMTLLAKATTASSGSVTSNDVMKVKYEYYASISGGTPFIFVTELRWFARGIGLIYNSFDDGINPTDVYNIGFYK